MTKINPRLKPHHKTLIFIALCMVLAFCAFAACIEYARVQF
jgi:hypothetical protein